MRIFYRLCILLFLGLLPACSPVKPVYQGEFDWKRWNIKKHVDCEYPDCFVYRRVLRLEKSFRLEAGDECYFLNGDQWLLKDPKDPAIWLCPVFCVGKGGGWAFFPEEQKMAE